MDLPQTRSVDQQGLAAGHSFEHTALEPLTTVGCDTDRYAAASATGRPGATEPRPSSRATTSSRRVTSRPEAASSSRSSSSSTTAYATFCPSRFPILTRVSGAFGFSPHFHRHDGSRGGSPILQPDPTITRTVGSQSSVTPANPHIRSADTDAYAPLIRKRSQGRVLDRPLHSTKCLHLRGPGEHGGPRQGLDIPAICRESRVRGAVPPRSLGRERRRGDRRRS